MRFAFTLTARTALLLHARNIDGEESIANLREKENASGVKTPKGDDRHPSWKYQTYWYLDDEAFLAFPADNIMASLREGGTQIIMRGQKTFKEITQSGIVCGSENFRILVNGKGINAAPLLKIKDLKYSEHAATAKELGFSLFAKYAQVNGKQHLRVRPRFDDWQIKGEVEVRDKILYDNDGENLRRIFDAAGRRGIGDWRPSCKKPGLYGQFEADIEKID
jgi:hypothetical protein